jgi:flagellar protein FlbD
VIPVTRLDGSPMIVNCEQIAWLEFMPDTVISLTNGEKLLVRESPDTVVERVFEYKRSVLGGVKRPACRIVELAPATGLGERP